MPENQKSPIKGSFLFVEPDVSYDEAIRTISEYAEMIFSEEVYERPFDDYFKQASYEQWACYDILLRLMDSAIGDCHCDPIAEIEWYMYEMETGERLSSAENRKEVFRAAADVASELLSLFACC